MTSSPQSATDFPRELAQLPENERISEAFGWAPSSWAGACLTIGVVTLLQPAKLHGAEWGILIVTLALGLLLIFYEAHRRRYPRVLVRRGMDVAIYQKDQWSRTVTAEAIQLFIRHPAQTWGAILACALAAAAFGAFLLPSSMAMVPADSLAAALAASSAASLCASTIRTRLFCEQCMVPYPDGRGFEQILVEKKDIRRIFGTPS